MERGKDEECQIDEEQQEEREREGGKEMTANGEN